MPSLPTPGGSPGSWGTELNAWLLVGHDASGNNLSGGFYNAYAYLREEQAANTSSGSVTTGSFQTRVLNTEVIDAAGIVTLSANQFTLQAGTYMIRARSPHYAAGRIKAKIRNVTDSIDALIGASGYCNNTATTQQDATVVGVFTIASAKVFELQYRAENTNGGTNGLGVSTNFGTEIYSEVEIWRLT